jgi:hypothetical protein
VLVCVEGAAAAYGVECASDLVGKGGGGREGVLFSLPVDHVSSIVLVCAMPHSFLVVPAAAALLGARGLLHPTADVRSVALNGLSQVLAVHGPAVVAASAHHGTDGAGAGAGGAPAAVKAPATGPAAAYTEAAVAAANAVWLASHDENEDIAATAEDLWASTGLSLRCANLSPFTPFCFLA